MEIKDMLGRVIREGDQVVWPGRRGSGLWQNVGTVSGFGETRDGQGFVPLVYVTKPDGSVTHTRELSRMVVIPPQPRKLKLFVRGRDSRPAESNIDYIFFSLPSGIGMHVAQQYSGDIEVYFTSSVRPSSAEVINGFEVSR